MTVEQPYCWRETVTEHLNFERYISASKDTFLSASEADEYSIASAVGSDYAEWVNAKYL